MSRFDKMSLGEKQREFPLVFAALTTWAYQQGYEFTLGEAYRPPETAALYASQGRGIVNTLHTKRLAQDINLFKDGVYLTATKDYEPLGKEWERLGGTWGGRFGDGGHFSISHEGIK